MDRYPNFTAPALTPEGLYSQDQKKRKRDAEESRMVRGAAYYYMRRGFSEEAIRRLSQIDKELENLEFKRRELYFERTRIFSKTPTQGE